MIAIYLPQFHPIPENDAWWGKGFTEWANVAKARPMFAGHYQPHIPADLGFYDLRLPEARKAQAELAREYGIHGFCYYHYWFNGKRLLGHPLDEVLRSGEPDFPFCLCWANENWTRVWDGKDDAVLAEQQYSDEDDRAHIEWLLDVFRDKRYIRIDGKPLMLVYKAGRMPSPRRTAETWRNAAREAGVGEIYLCRVESSAEESGDPRDIGFDASIEFQPDWGNLGEPVAEIGETGHRIFDYASFVKRQMGKPGVRYRRFPCVTPSWDNAPRRSSGALTIAHSDPATYGAWLSGAIEKVRAWPAQEKIVFINAWNEWAEGNHLEPDLRFGRSYLEATRDALVGSRSLAAADSQAVNEMPVAAEAALLPDPLPSLAVRVRGIQEGLQDAKADCGSEAAPRIGKAAGELAAIAEELEEKPGRFHGQTSWQDEVRAREQRIVALEREIRRIKASYSWAVTRPLRYLSELAARLLR